MATSENITVENARFINFSGREACSTPACFRVNKIRCNQPILGLFYLKSEKFKVQPICNIGSSEFAGHDQILGGRQSFSSFMPGKKCTKHPK